MCKIIIKDYQFLHNNEGEDVIRIGWLMAVTSEKKIDSCSRTEVEKDTQNSI